jgi:hypothetical protein
VDAHQQSKQRDVSEGYRLTRVYGMYRSATTMRDDNS